VAASHLPACHVVSVDTDNEKGTNEERESKQEKAPGKRKKYSII
jgi:hypothetical protein